MERIDQLKHIITVKDDDVLHPYDPNKLVGFLNSTINFIPTKDTRGNYTIVGQYCKNVVLTNNTADEYNDFVVYQSASLDVILIKLLKKARLPIQFVDCQYFTDRFNKDIKPLALTNPQKYDEALAIYTEQLRKSIKEVIETNVKTAIENNIEITDDSTKEVAERLKKKGMIKTPGFFRTK